jgi:hypothetical protein
MFEVHYSIFFDYEYPCPNAGGEESLVSKLIVISEICEISVERFFSCSSFRMTESGWVDLLWLILFVNPLSLSNICFWISQKK